MAMTFQGEFTRFFGSRRPIGMISNGRAPNATRRQSIGLELFRTHRPRAFVDSIRRPPSSLISRSGHGGKHPPSRLRRSARHASGEGPSRSRMGFPWFGRGLPRSTRKGFATQACDLFGFACEVTAAAPEHVGACRAGMVPAPRREPHDVAESHPRSGSRPRSRPHVDGAGGSLSGRRRIRRHGFQRIRRRRRSHHA